MTIDASLANQKWIIVPEDLRFRAGKLLMLSPKHKEVLQKYAGRASTSLYEKKVGTKSFPLEEGYVEPQNWTLRLDGILGVGEPFLLIADPYQVDNRLLKLEIERRNAINPQKEGWYARHGTITVEPVLPRYFHSSYPIHWVMSISKNEKLYTLTVSPKAWKHYMCLVVPRRVSKYDLK